MQSRMIYIMYFAFCVTLIYLLNTRLNMTLSLLPRKYVLFSLYILSPNHHFFPFPSLISDTARREERIFGDSPRVASNATKIEFTEKQFYVPVTTDYYRALIAI